jgi:hypothetical protein
VRLISAVLFAVLCAAYAAPAHAQAHYFAWIDADYGFKVAFPDTWKQQGGLPADARIRLLAPGPAGAQCTVFTRHDNRFTIYPHDYLVDVVAQQIQWDYWDQAVANYDDLYFYYDNYGALGGSDARYTLVDYIDRTTEPGIRKRAQVFATIYGNLHMMTLCSAPLKDYDAYAADFGQIVDSINFAPQYTPNVRGYYRDFLETKEYNYHWYEPIISLFLPRKTMSTYVNCSRTKDFSACSSKPNPLPIQTR